MPRLTSASTTFSAIGAVNFADFLVKSSGPSAIQLAKLYASDIKNDADMAYNMHMANNGLYILSHSQYIRRTNTTIIEGAGYIFYNNGGTWEQQAKIRASDGVQPDGLGYSGDIDATGTYVILGAYQETTSPKAYQGAIYTYYRSGTSWIQSQKLIAPDAANGAAFGSSIGISGSLAVVGAPYHWPGGGKAYIYSRGGNNWNYLTSFQGASLFGSSVDISNNTVAIGSYTADNSGVSGVGSVSIYAWSGNIFTWNLQATLGPTTIATNAYYGSQVSIDGDTLAVWATGQKLIYMYDRSGTTWSLSQTISANSVASYYRSQLSLAGNTLVLGAQNLGSSNYAGAVLVYTRPTSADPWDLKYTVTAADAAALDRLGYSAATNGTILAAGASFQTTGSSCGGLYVFDIS